MSSVDYLKERIGGVFGCARESGEGHQGDNEDSLTA